MCAHGGQASPTETSTRVMVSNMAIVTVAAPYTVAACPDVTPPGNGPCVTANWVVGAVRVMSEDQPVAITTGTATCIPTGTPLLPRSSADPGACNLNEDAMNLNFPYQFDGRGRTAQAASNDDYVRQLIEQVLFTSPGERVNLPDFGSGLLQLAFAPNSVELAAATQFSVQGALQKWLSSYIRVVSVQAQAQDALITVTVA